MTKKLLYSFAAACTLFLGSASASAAVLDGANWKFSPENGGSTETLPNTGNPFYQPITFRMDGISLDDWDNTKVSVKYAGKTIPFNTLSHGPIYEEDGDDPTDPIYYGYSFAPVGEYDGVVVRVNYQVFTEPGTLEITLKEGAFTTEDGDVSPALNYTHTFGGDAPVVEDGVIVKAYRPEPESVVKSLSSFTMYFDIARLGDNQVFCDASKADLITLTKAGATEPVKATSVAFDESAYMEETIPYTVTFPATAEAGEYTVTVPAGFFWAAAEDGEKPADAIVNEELTVKYTIDPNAKTGMKLFKILEPAQSPETVEKFEEVVIDFPDIQGQIQFADDADVTITKDGTPLAGVTCYLSYNWNYGNMHTAGVTFEKDEDTYVIKEAGTYEVTIPAGAIYQGEDFCDEIKATINVVKGEKTYTWTAIPANEGHIDMPTDPERYTTFTFHINGASEISYDEWEDPNHDPIYGTETKTIQVLYNGVSVKNVANVAQGGEENIGYSLRDNMEYPEIVIGISNKVFTKGGVLEVKIDEGRCTADGSYPTPAIDYTCTIGEIQEAKDYEVVVSPAMDIDTEYFIDYFKDGFKIEFTNAETVVPNMIKDYDDDDNPIMVLEKTPHLSVGNVIYYGDVNFEEIKGAEHPTFIITYPDMFDIDTTLGGSINFSVDEGTFTVDGEFDSPAISQTWRLKRIKEVDTSYIFGPEGDIVNEGYGLFGMISFNIDEYVSLDRSGVVVKFDGEPISDYVLSVLNGDNKCIYLQLESEKYKNPELTGALSIEIPEGAVTVSGIAIGAISKTWNIVLPKTFTYIVNGFASKYTGGPTYDVRNNNELTTDLPSIADLSEITLEIPEAKTAKVWKESYINLRSRDYMTYGARMPEVEEVVGAEHPTFKLKFADAPTIETIYELSFNYSAFYIDNAYMSPNLDFAAIFDKNAGIDGITGGEAEAYTAVSLDGRVLFINGTIDQVKSLDKGIYIINGKKIAIK